MYQRTELYSEAPALHDNGVNNIFMNGYVSPWNNEHELTQAYVPLYPAVSTAYRNWPDNVKGRKTRGFKIVSYTSFKRPNPSVSSTRSK